MSAPSRGRVLSTPSGAGCAEGASHARVRLVGAEVRDLAVDQVHVALGAARELGVMGDEQDRGAHLVDLLEQVHHLARHQGIEVAGRLVREQECRVPGDGARDGDALLLPAGELRGHVPGARGEPDQLERAADALAPVGAAQAAVAQRHFDVVVDVEVGDEVEALKDEADALVAEPRARIIGKRPHILALEQVAAGVELLEQPRHVEHGGLPRSFPQVQLPMATSAARLASRMSEITTSSPTSKPRSTSASVREAAPSTTGTRSACEPRTTYSERAPSSM